MKRKQTLLTYGCNIYFPTFPSKAKVRLSAFSKVKLDAEIEHVSTDDKKTVWHFGHQAMAEKKVWY